jgi:hypothetical protein
MTTMTHSPHGPTGRRTYRLVPLAFLALALYAASAAAPARSASETALPPYGWPVKPFDKPHPVRGSFGDPRTVFAGAPSQRTLLTGAGSFSFHFGIDVSAPDGTSVYPIESGTVTTVTKDWVAVAGSNGRSFQYWHIAAAVHVGQSVTARVTVLGRILRSCGHVHLSEYDHGVIVNPLAPGHLAPYKDRTAPSVTSIEFRHTVAGSDLMPELLRGTVEIVASAQDFPTLTVPAPWTDMPVTPALLRWSVVAAKTGRVLVPARTVYDVRDHLPAHTDFWRVYARGTHQNMTVFGKHYSYMQPGRYLFRLAPDGFDTHSVPDGVYDLVVTATDIHGNHGSLAQRFSVHNAPGVVGP